MKRLLAVWILLCILPGCAGGKRASDSALSLRTRLQDADGCSFRCRVTADYGDSVTEFTMDCVTTQSGDMSFTLLAPETIQGIKGEIAQSQGALTFDDKVLLVQLLADGQLTPLCCPWLMVRTLLGGIVRACGDSAEGSEVIYDDVYASEAFQMYAYLDGDAVPSLCEFVWQGRRIMSVQVEDFKIL